MSETHTVRSRPASAVALALVIVLALLVAPACAPLCAARACSSGPRLDHCHDMAGMGTGAAQFAARGKVCLAADFSAVLVKADEQPFFRHGGRTAAATSPVRVSFEKVFEGLQTFPGRGNLQLIPMESRDSLLLTTILRI